MDKTQQDIDNEIISLQSSIESDPQATLYRAEECVARCERVIYDDGIIRSKIIVALCYWNLMNYRKGMKAIRDAFSLQQRLEMDEHTPYILHVIALQYWGQAKYYSAQQYWINALEQAALAADIEIQIECLIGLGNIWRITNEQVKAKSAHHLAAKIANTHRIEKLECKAKILLAYDLYQLNEYIEMLSILDSAEDSLTNNPDPTWLAEIWDFRGLALLGLGRIEDAEVATVKAYEISVHHELTWMKAHSFISRARLELIRKNYPVARELLTEAEEAAKAFDNGELLSQICFQQSILGEESGNYKDAYLAFKRYREHSLNTLQQQTARLGSDKARLSKAQLEQRALRLINRLRGEAEAKEFVGSAELVSETFWWEKLMLFKTQLKQSHYSIILIKVPSEKVMDTSLDIAKCITNTDDFVSQLNNEYIGVLLAEKGKNAANIFDKMQQFFEHYPWFRLDQEIPDVSLSRHEILSFPFTLTQLQEMQFEEHD